MKTIMSAVAIFTILTLPVFADHHNVPMKGDCIKEGGMMDDMMCHKQMKAMHDHMEKMQHMMSNIKKETDPQKCREMMHEHMQAMHQGMMMMNHDMENMPKDMDIEKPEQMGNMDMMKRMDMMDHRMVMMQMMMGQMMEHESVEQTGTCNMP